MKLVGIAIVLDLVIAGGCANEARNESIRAANAGAKAYGQKQIETAISQYKRAVELLPENDVAWYGRGGAYAERKDWTNAADAMSHAVQYVPDQGMYQLYYGRFLYEKAIRT